ncbi:MAG TPA: enoyl-CoA hydratase/isomerase family protein [Burkholderiales bacterium]|nr:enoyl-CoA hydratase/isomerase family protein [Burkholderiales bacterium]
MSGDLLVAVEGPLLRVTINRPEKRNPLSRGVLTQIRDSFVRHAGNAQLSLAVVQGAGDKSFAAGGDLKEFMQIRELADAEALFDIGFSALDAIRRFPVPVVAALNGLAVGGGAELGVACDVRVAAPHARIGFVQGTLNISTGWGGGLDLMAHVGVARAVTLLGGARILEAAEALAIGLVEAVAPEGTPFAEFVEHFIEPFLRQRPQVMRAFKAQAIAARFGTPRAEADAADRRHFALTWCHDDHWRAVDRLLSREQR